MGTSEGVVELERQEVSGQEFVDHGEVVVVDVIVAGGYGIGLWVMDTGTCGRINAGMLR